ncbi:MAG TPA: hypothetical protein VII01_10645 [Solirubrobacteraceae bacterium]
MAKGFYLADENGIYFAELNEGMGRMGVSADVAVEESSIQVTDIDEIGPNSSPPSYASPRCHHHPTGRRSSKPHDLG